MKFLKIKGTDIILQNYDQKGQGKIIVSDNWMGSFSYVWGGMESDIEEFIQTIHSDYFADKLCSNRYVFSAKKSVSNVRKFIREELIYDLPWYKFPEAQKEMRANLKELENCTSENEFVDRMLSFVDDIIVVEISFEEQREFEDIIKPVFTCEPWNFIGEDLSEEYKWLCNIHRELKLQLAS